jgi:hypothetical protein
MTYVLGLEGIAPGITRGFYSLILLLYFVVLDAYAIVAFPPSSVTLTSPDASSHGFFISGSGMRPSGSLSPFVVMLVTFSTKLAIMPKILRHLVELFVALVRNFEASLHCDDSLWPWHLDY